MIRRSRISVRPNVKPTGRVPATSRDASQDNPQAAQAPAELAHDAGVKPAGDEVRPAPSAPAAEPNNSNNNAEIQSDSIMTEPELSNPAGDAASQNTTPSSASMSGPQRRKRFTVLPNFTKPRTSSAPAPTHTSSRTPKSPVKAAVSTPEPPETTALAPAPQAASESRGKRRLSGGGRQPKARLKPVAPLQVSSEAPAASLEQDRGPPSANQNAGSSCPSEEIQSEPVAPAGNLPQSHQPQLVPSEKETVIQEQNDGVSPEKSRSIPQKENAEPRATAHVPQALRTINDPTDRLRLAKAKKLRELLKKEMNKDKQKEKHERPKIGIKERKSAKDHTKMTMRELIYYLPSTNPMKSYVEEEQRTSETVLPPPPKAAPTVAPPVPPERGEEDGEQEEETPGSETREEEPLLAPRVKVAEDGSLIIDEESLTVEVLRVKGPNPAEERDPIFERGSTTTYSSFRKGTYTKPWSNRETDMFFLAISMVGTDFSMIGQLFPHRARIEIKNKFKKEERANSWRIDKAFKERRRLDLDFFNNLLEKILKDEEKKRKKKKDTSKLPKVPRIPQRKSTVRKKVCSSSGSEEESSGSDVMEGEKENEGVSNDGGSTTTPITPRRKSAKNDTNKAAEVADTEDAENSAVEGQSPVDRLQQPNVTVEKPDLASSGIKPAQLKGRAQRALPNLERKWRNKGPALLKKAQDTHTSTGEEKQKEKGSKVSSASVWEKEKRIAADIIACGLEDSEEEEEPDLTAVQEHILNKPTRSGRIPKLSQHVIRATADEDEEEEPESLPVPPSKAPSSNNSVSKARKKPGPTLKRGMPRRGKSRLVTLRASAAEEDDDDDEEDYDTTQDEEQYRSNAAEEENQAFVPMGLRSQPQVHTEVEETMEELDISVNVPDVLGISQNAVCPESSCERGSVPCEHQLDLLVDVIEFLDPEHMEVSESYAEAARTLLTIGASGQMTPAIQAPSTGEDVIIIEEPSRFVQQDVQQEVVLETTEHSEVGDESCQVVISDPSVSVASECKEGLDPASNVYGDNLDQVISRADVAEPYQQDSNSTNESISPQETEILPSSNNLEMKTSEQTGSRMRRNRLLKPRPNLGRTSRSIKTQQKPISPAKGIVTVEKSTVVSLTSSVKTTAEAQMVERNPMEASERKNSEESEKVSEDNEQDSAHTPAVTSQNELEENGSALPDPKASVSREEKPEGEVSEVEICVEEEKMEAGEQRLQQQQPLSGNESLASSSISESSVPPSQPLRRCRGPKPKPNLLRSSRTARPHTEQKPPQTTEVLGAKEAAVKLSSDTLTDTQIPVEATSIITEPVISQTQAQPETEAPSNALMAVHTASPEELPRGVSTQDCSDASEIKTGGVSEEVIECVSTEASEISAEVYSADLLLEPDLASDEPIYILSLSEVPSTFAEREEFSAKSELPSEPQSNTAANVGGPGSDGDQVSHLLLPDLFVPVSEEQEEKQMDVDEKEEAKECSRENEKKENEEEDLNQISKRGHSLLTQREAAVEGLAEHVVPSLSSEADGSSEDTAYPAKRRKLPETGRRAKLQIKPNPVQRKRLCGLAAKELPPLPPEETSSIPASSQQTMLLSEESLPLTSLTKDTASTSVSPEDVQISDTLSQPVSIETLPSQTAPDALSQSTVGQEGPPETEALESASSEETEASGSGPASQPVHQVTPLATTGVLTRPGRRPRGFLSFMSSASTQGSSSATRGAAAGPQRPAVNTSRSERRRATPGPLTSVSKSASPSQKPSKVNPPLTSRQPTVPSASTPAPAPAPAPAPVPAPVPAPEVRGQSESLFTNPTAEEEPTSVSAYFFSDIFTEVDEQEEME
ncbi:transcription factor TFIIIB component B'' homolog isoform X1 [Pygocentrus nattereri]|uniref:Myb-like domain-containing protein n=1 Tax=Pygocentrus nattereri TaxID=42514 RepID=A0A3B4CJU0_PYGNA|nr:transcription factor TFIIIB component B'' homolog isoform X1 [Pygocentrus nattereri]XP_037401925.1 transcription factor TFIIIB component B'' homolog isoform X1 [Pygocentrus nattereri]XP_037401926.1 transcription factor TFIIIB component B'' homolog isoform X1 [Pygocentrus nattereri]